MKRLGWWTNPFCQALRRCQPQGDGYLGVPQLVRLRSAEGGVLDRAAQILLEGFVHLVVGQWFLALVADQVKEPKGEPLLKQGQAAWAWPGLGI